MLFAAIPTLHPASVKDAEHAQTFTGYVSDARCGRNINAACNKKCLDAGESPALILDGTGQVLATKANEQLKNHPGDHVQVTGTVSNGVLDIAAVTVLPSPRIADSVNTKGQNQNNQINSPARIAADTFSFPAGKSAVQVPVEILANGVFVLAQLNGKGPFLFEIDTGSSGSVFASELVDELGVKIEGETTGMGAGSTYKMGVVRGKIEFTLPGGLKLSTQDATTVSMAGLWPLLGRRMYGDIGYDVLKDIVVEFDYQRKMATFYDPATFDYSGHGQKLTATLAMDFDPQIAGVVAVPGPKNIPSNFTIDTGAGGTIIPTDTVKTNHLLETLRERLPAPSHGVGGGESNDVVARIASLSLGSYEIQRPLVALSQDTVGSLATPGRAVNLGGNILGRFTLTIDYPRKIVALEPNSHFADPFPADASGLVLRADGRDFRTFTVQAIVPGSPAEGAGIHEGDVIIKVDGEPAVKYALWELQDLLKASGRHIRLDVKRGERSFQCELLLRALV